MSPDILPLFCDLDDFCQLFEPQFNEHLLATGTRQRLSKPTLWRWSWKSIC